MFSCAKSPTSNVRLISPANSSGAILSSRAQLDSSQNYAVDET